MSGSVLRPLDDPPAPAQRLGLKIDVDSLRGALAGVPALIDVLERHAAHATFLFALGPDRTGRMLTRLTGVGRNFGRGGGAVRALERYGFAGLWYGTLLPAPSIGVAAERVIRDAAAAGFEIGVRSWSAHTWSSHLREADAEWIRDQMQLAHDRFVQIFGMAPRVHGACDWQMNRHALRLTQRLGFDYCSDTRGLRPFVPIVDAEIVACPQIPTTLPTFGELLADPLTTRDNVDTRMLEAIATPASQGHVLTLSADVEGLALLPAFERLLQALGRQGKRVLSLAEYIAAADTSDLPRYRIETGSVPGHPRPLAMQFKEFLA